MIFLSTFSTWELNGKLRDDHKHVYEGRDRKTGAIKWTVQRFDLVFGANSELRALAEVYGCSDAGTSLYSDFVKVWTSYEP